MTWVQIRSRRDPAFWVPVLASFLVGFLVALAAYASWSEWHDHLRELVTADPEAAAAEAVHMLRCVSWSLCIVLAGFSVFLLRYFQLGHRESRLPPSGWWSLGAYRVAVGPSARWMSRIGLVLSVLLFGAAIGLPLAVEHLLRVLHDGGLVA